MIFRQQPIGGGDHADRHREADQLARDPRRIERPHRGPRQRGRQPPSVSVDEEFGGNHGACRAADDAQRRQVDGQSGMREGNEGKGRADEPGETGRKRSRRAGSSAVVGTQGERRPSQTLIPLDQAVYRCRPSLVALAAAAALPAAAAALAAGAAGAAAPIAAALPAGAAGRATADAAGRPAAGAAGAAAAPRCCRWFVRCCRWCSHWSRRSSGRCCRCSHLRAAAAGRRRRC